MKRTYEQSLTFFNHRNTENRGDNRELYKTPEYLIKCIVSNLLIRYPFLRDKVWIDPCAADGRWGKIIEKEFKIQCSNYDIKPLNNNVKEQDFLNLSEVNKDLFFIGNPPFSLVKHFVNKALEITDCCYFLGGSCLITGSLSNKVSLLHRFEGFEGNQKDKRSKATFIDTKNKEVIIWCCGALFNNKTSSLFKREKEYKEDYFAVSPKMYCYNKDNRIEVILNERKEYDIHGK